jgi:hypothetical protein
MSRRTNNATRQDYRHVGRSYQFIHVESNDCQDWAYCNHAQQLTSVIKSTKDWDSLKFRRRLETFGNDDGPGKSWSLTDYYRVV